MNSRHPLATLVVLGLLFAACYNPSIESGKLQCTATGGCPDDFVCEAGFCVSKGGAGGTGGTLMCEQPYGPIAGCSPDTSVGICDPVCQTGCKCDERCGATSGTPECERRARPFAGANESCNTGNDSCRPGMICLPEVNPTCGAHCYRYCRDDNDCPSPTTGKCVIDLTLGGFKVCSPPVDSCNPFITATTRDAPCVSTSDRPSPQFGCYIISGQQPDLAVCDCAGTKTQGEECMFEHECTPGFECVQSGSGPAVCRRVCKMGEPLLGLGGCPPAFPTCTRFNNGTKHGYCL